MQGPDAPLVVVVVVCTCPTERALITTGCDSSTFEKSCVGDWAMITSKAAGLVVCVPASGGLLIATQVAPAPGALTVQPVGARQVVPPCALLAQFEAPP